MKQFSRIYVGTSTQLIMKHIQSNYVHELRFAVVFISSLVSLFVS